MQKVEAPWICRVAVKLVDVLLDEATDVFGTLAKRGEVAFIDFFISVSLYPLLRCFLGPSRQMTECRAEALKLQQLNIAFSQSSRKAIYVMSDNLRVFSRIDG